MQRNGKTYYVYPDPAHNQMYVGKRSQYQAYQQMRLAKHLSNEDLEATRWDVWDSFETSPMN